MCVCVLGRMERNIDPRGRPTVTASIDHCFRTCAFESLSVRPHFSQNKTNFQVKTMFATGETVSLAEWIIDDPNLVNFFFLIFFLNFLGANITAPLTINFGSENMAQVVIIFQST